MNQSNSTNVPHDICLETPYRFSTSDGILGSTVGTVISVAGLLFNGITIVALLKYKSTR